MSASKFTDRVFRPATPEEKALHESVPFLKWNDPSLGDLNDPKYQWAYFGRSAKMDGYAFCPVNKVRRGLTMGEFYGAGTVD
ncbi:hypothetical protein [Neptuniibacter sp. QD37_11]|uniref:hypothetical protein n=1 Tax=Neptuniibacter sp. QD37_11 TaxID=3398209 RepID=UPI0039F533BD